MSRIPLRKEAADAVRQRWKTSCHPGLAMDKFAPAWFPRNLGDDKKGECRRTFFTDLAQLSSTLAKAKPSIDLFAAHIQRLEELKSTLDQTGWQVRKIELTTDWRLVVGLGISHPFETGLAFDRTYGVVSLAGSAVKGAARHWAEEQATTPGSTWTAEQVNLIFGTEDNVPEPGAAVFFDAFPTTWTKLAPDVLTPHYKKYYEDPNKNPPADWYSPEPTYFLTVQPRQQYRFIVAVREELPSDLAAEARRLLFDGAEVARSKVARAILDKAVEALQGAAKVTGMGGKSAVGYGYFT